MSYERGSKPKRPSFPRSRTSVPGFSRSASQGWLNQVTLIVAVSSATRATIRVRRRPRIGRFSTLRTRPLTTTSSPWRRAAIATSSAAVSYRRGRCSSTSRTVASPSFPSFRRVVAATPGSESRASSSRCGRRARGVGGQAPGWSRPAKTVCRRVAVIVRGTRPTGASRSDRTSESPTQATQACAYGSARRHEEEPRREDDDREAKGVGEAHIRGRSQDHVRHHADPEPGDSGEHAGEEARAVPNEERGGAAPDEQPDAGTENPGERIPQCCGRRPFVARAGVVLKE